MELCNKCGTELNEQGICPNCGAEEAVNETPAEVLEETAPETAAGETPGAVTEEEPEAVTEEEPEAVTGEVPETVDEAASAEPSDGGKPVKSDNGLLARIIACVAALAIIFGLFALTGRSYKKVAKEYMQAAINGKPQKIAKLIPGDVVDLYTEVMYDGDKEKFYDSIDELSYLSKEIEEKDIKPSKVKVKIKDVEDLDESTLKYAKLTYHSKRIKKGKKVTLEVTLPDEDNPREFTVNTVKKGRKWYYYG